MDAAPDGWEPLPSSFRRCSPSPVRCPPETTTGRTRSSGTACAPSLTWTAAAPGRSGGTTGTHRVVPGAARLGETLGARPAILDGEIVALDEDGRPGSGRLPQRLELSGRSQIIRGAREIPATYVAFDVLHLDGRSLLDLGYDERRELLESLGLSGGSLLTGDSFHGVAGADVLAAARQLGFEGIVAKRRDAPYRPGQRSDAWLTIRPGWP